MNSNYLSVPFRHRSLCVVLGMLLCGSAVAADKPKAADEADQGQTLKSLQGVGKRVRTHRREKDVTGLGKIIKSSETLNKQQVIDIRDLVRYDPGVAVVEQGRGASSGYSIRGVDKNRVATTVDGIAQVQSYAVQGARPGSGAINEVEYENIASVEISKGASSSEYGSGSLGGAVGFRTKEAEDLIGAGKNWGVQAKTAYSSKNRQWVKSLGGAFRQGAWEGLLQYTTRRGEAIRPHKDAVNSTVYQITRLGGYPNEYDHRYADGDGFKRSTEYFILEDECPDFNCTPKARAVVSNALKPVEALSNPTAKQQQWLDKTQHITERVSASDYTGPGRVLPDPLTYRTGSWLARGGYRFSPRHSVGTVYENTVQRYDTRDMSLPTFYPVTLANREYFGLAGGVYRGGRYLDGLVAEGGTGLQWSRTQYVDEKHRKQRWGVFYRYNNPDKDSALDTAQLSFDHQNIRIDNTLEKRYCSEYPTVDKNCRATADKAGSYNHTDANRYSERHHLLRLDVGKELKWGAVRNRLSASVGVDRFESVLNRNRYESDVAAREYELVHVAGRRGNGAFETPYLYRKVGESVSHVDYCQQNLSSFYACGKRRINGHNAFFGLRNNISFGQYVDVGLGVRYDRHRFRSSDKWTASNSFRNWSWNTGLVVKPTANVALSYRASSGYRVPSFQELFGYRLPGHEQGKDDKFHRPTEVVPEKSLNHEWGLTLKGVAGTLELTQFDNRYRGLIAVSEKYDPELKLGLVNYRNAQDVRLKGVNIAGRLDGNGVWDKIPDGLYATVAFNRIKPKSVKNRPDLAFVESYLLDTVQPSRYILGLGYDHPEKKWGTNLNFTYSKPKNPDELRTYYQGGTGRINKAGSAFSSRAWKTVDVSAYYSPYKNLTLRGSVYNLTNYRYVTWEALRQTSAGAVNRHAEGGNYARYAAPGRNFAVSVEMKF